LSASEIDGSSAHAVPKHTINIVIEQTTADRMPPMI
jgi:hypothetical protein